MPLLDIVDHRATGAEPPANRETTVQDKVVERRRPGRIENPGPELIRLMRRDFSGVTPPSPETWDEAGEPCDDLRPATGLVNAIFLSSLLWSGIAGLVYVIA